MNVRNNFHNIGGSNNTNNRNGITVGSCANGNGIRWAKRSAKNNNRYDGKINHIVLPEELPEPLIDISEEPTVMPVTPTITNDTIYIPCDACSYDTYVHDTHIRNTRPRNARGQYMSNDQVKAACNYLGPQKRIVRGNNRPLRPRPAPLPVPTNHVATNNINAGLFTLNKNVKPEYEQLDTLATVACLILKARQDLYGVPFGDIGR